MRCRHRSPCPGSSTTPERGPSKSGDPSGNLGRGADLWGRMYCRSEPVLQTSCCECDSHRLHHFPVAQQTRALPCEGRGRECNSRRESHFMDDEVLRCGTLSRKQVEPEMVWGECPPPSATLSGTRKKGNPPGLGPGNTRGSTEVPDQFLFLARTK